MSKSPKSNPVNYRLKPVERPDELYQDLDKARHEEEFGSGSKQAVRQCERILKYWYNHEFAVRNNQIARIINSLIKQARAAYTHGRATRLEQGSSAEPSWAVKKYDELAQSTEKSINHLGSVATQEVLLNNIPHAQSYIDQARRCLREFQASAFHKERSKTFLKGLRTTAPNNETWLEEIKAIFKRLWTAYPYVTAKNRHRLAKALRAHLSPYQRAEWRKAGNIYPKQLLEAGIPAAEIIGPWWIRSKDIKSPMDLIKASGPGSIYGDWHSSPTPFTWLASHDLDGNDRQLVESIETYYRQHHQAPSIEWARRRSNELEEARAEKEVGDNADTVTEWLDASDSWRRRGHVFVPPMPDPTFRVLEAKSSDGELLCRAARRDGLCVVDRIVDLVKNTDTEDSSLYDRSDEEGFVTLIISTDPKRRTVVGLNSEGVCTSEHHCTGMQNRVDKVAYEYFRVFRKHDKSSR
jgi:hypothetical protein